MAKLVEGAFPPTINSVDDWLINWPPKESFHWRDGKSAKELAKAWFDGGRAAVPTGFQALLDSHPATAKLQIESVAGEELVVFDSFGEPRHCDLVMRGTTESNKVVVHVEAKADERFGSHNALAAWREAIRRKPNSNVPKRVAQLSKSLFGAEVDPANINSLAPGIALVRYQLLYSIGATVADALRTGATLAVFVVHELLPIDVSTPFIGTDGKSRLLSPGNIARNEEDFTYCVRQMSSHDDEMEAGHLMDCGVFPRGISDGEGVLLLVGKARDITFQGYRS